MDLRRTTPPVAEIIDRATAVFYPHKLLFGVQAFEIVDSDSLAEVTARFDASALNVYEHQSTRQESRIARRNSRVDHLVSRRRGQYVTTAHEGPTSDNALLEMRAVIVIGIADLVPPPIGPRGGRRSLRVQAAASRHWS